MTFQNIKAVIFDMDGLMFDTETLFFQAHNEVAKKYGKEFTMETQLKMMGKKPLEVMNIMKESCGIEEEAETLLLQRNAIYEESLKTSLKPMPKLFPLLDLLEKNNLRKAIATSANKAWVDLILNQFKIKERFEFVITGEEVLKGKPDPEIYVKALKRIELRPEECVVLEDSLNGIRAAKAAGCVAIAVPSEFTKYENFEIADRVILDLLDPILVDLFLMQD